MKLNELKNIMEKHKIWVYDYCLNEKDKPLAETALCLMKTDRGFEYYVCERNIKRDMRLFQSEDEACQAFLTDMAYDKPILKRYL